MWEKGFVLGVECLLNCFPHSVPHRPTATKTSPLVQMCSDRRGAGHRGDLQVWPGAQLSVSPVLHTHNSVVRSFRTISSFSTDSSYPLLPVSTESFGTKPVKTGKVMPQVMLGNKLLHGESYNSPLVVTKWAAPSEVGEQPWLPVQGWDSSTSGDTALQDKQWTIHLTLSHHLKIYCCSCISNIQQGTDSAHILTQGNDFWTTNKNSSWLLSVTNPAGIYTSLRYVKLLKSILVKKKKNVAQEGQSPGTALGRSYSCAQFWVLPKCHCSAAATRDWRSDKQVKNSLKNRDKNIPTVSSVASTLPTWSFVFQCTARFEEAASGRKNEAEIEKECLCVWNTSCGNNMDSLLYFSAQQWFS